MDFLTPKRRYLIDKMLREGYIEGKPGPPGVPGPSGTPGPPGNEGKSAYEVWLDAGNTGSIEDFLNSLKGSAKTYTHTQIASLSEWEITHNLDKYPAVTVVDSAGSVVVGDISYINSDKVVLNFSAEFAGKAYLN